MPNLLKSLPREILEKEDSKFIYNVLNPLLFEKVRDINIEHENSYTVGELLNKDIYYKNKFLPQFRIPYNIDPRAFHVYMNDSQEKIKLERYSKKDLVQTLDDIKDFIFFYFAIEEYNFLQPICSLYFKLQDTYNINKELYDENYKKYLETPEIYKKKVYKSTYEHYKLIVDEHKQLIDEFDIILTELSKHNEYSIHQIVDNIAGSLSSLLNIRTFDNEIIFAKSVLVVYLEDYISYDKNVVRYVFSGKEKISYDNFVIDNIVNLLAIFSLEISSIVEKYKEYQSILVDNNGMGYALEKSQTKLIREDVFSNQTINLDSDNLTYFLNEEDNNLEIYFYLDKNLQVDESTFKLYINGERIYERIVPLDGEELYGYFIKNYFDDNTMYYKVVVKDYIIYDLNGLSINHIIEDIRIDTDIIGIVFEEKEYNNLTIYTTGFLDNFIIYKYNDSGFYEKLNVAFKVKVGIEEQEERYIRTYEIVGLDESSHQLIIENEKLIIGFNTYNYVYEPKIYVDFFNDLNKSINFRFHTIIEYVLIDDIMYDNFELNYYSDFEINDFNNNIRKTVFMDNGKAYKKSFERYNYSNILNPYNENVIEIIDKITLVEYKQRNTVVYSTIVDNIKKIPFYRNLIFLNKFNYDQERNLIIFNYCNEQLIIQLNDGLNRGLHIDNLKFDNIKNKINYCDQELCEEGFVFANKKIYLKNPITEEYDEIEAVSPISINKPIINSIYFDSFEMIFIIEINEKRFNIKNLYIANNDEVRLYDKIIYIDSLTGIPRLKIIDMYIDINLTSEIFIDTKMNNSVYFDSKEEKLFFIYDDLITIELELEETEFVNYSHRDRGMTVNSIFYAGNVLPQNSNSQFFGRENIYSSMMIPDNVYMLGRGQDKINDSQQHNLLGEQLDIDINNAKPQNLEEEPYLMFKTNTSSLKGLESYLKSNLKAISNDINVSSVYMVQRNKFISEWARVSTVLPSSIYIVDTLKELVADLMETKLISGSYDDLIDIFKNNNYEHFSLDTNNIHNILIEYIRKYLEDDFLLEQFDYYLIHNVWIENNLKDIVDFIKENADNAIVSEVSMMTFNQYDKERLFYIFTDELEKIKKDTIETYKPIINYSDWNDIQDNNHVHFEKPFKYDILDINGFIKMSVDWKEPLLLIRPIIDDGVFSKKDYRLLDYSMITNSYVSFSDNYNEYEDIIKYELNKPVDYLFEVLDVLNRLSIEQGFDILSVNLVIIRWFVERFLPNYILMNDVKTVEEFKKVIYFELKQFDHPNLSVEYNKIKEHTLLADLGNNVDEIYKVITDSNLVYNSFINLEITDLEELTYLDNIKQPVEHYFDYLFNIKRYDLITKILALFTEDVIASSMLDLSMAINIKDSKGDATYDIYEKIVQDLFDEFLPFHTVLDKIIFTIKIMESSSAEAVSKEADIVVGDRNIIDIISAFSENIRIQTIDRSIITSKIGVIFPSEGLKLCGAHDEIPYDYDRSVKVGGHDLMVMDDETYGIDDEWYVLNKEIWKQRPESIYTPPNLANLWWECIPENEFEKVVDTYIDDYFHIKQNIFEQDNIIESHFIDYIPTIDIMNDIDDVTETNIIEDYLIDIDTEFNIRFYDMEQLPMDLYGLDEYSGPEDQTTLIGMKDLMHQTILHEFYEQLNIAVLDSIWTDICILYDVLDIPGHDEFAIDEYFHQSNPTILGQDISAMVYDSLLEQGFETELLDMNDISLKDKYIAKLDMVESENIQIKPIDTIHTEIHIWAGRERESFITDNGTFIPGHNEFAYDEFYHNSADLDRIANMVDSLLIDALGIIRIDFGFMRMLPIDPYSDLISQKFYRANQPGSDMHNARVRDSLLYDIHVFSKDIIRINLLDFYTIDIIDENLRSEIYSKIDNDNISEEYFANKITDSLINRHIRYDFREYVVSLDKYASIINDESIVGIFGINAANVERDNLFKLEISDNVYIDTKHKMKIERGMTKFDRDYLRSIKIEEDNFVLLKYKDDNLRTRLMENLKTYFNMIEKTTILLNENEYGSIKQINLEKQEVSLLDRLYYGHQSKFIIDGMTISLNDKLIDVLSNKIYSDSLVISQTEKTFLEDVAIEYEFDDRRLSEYHDLYGQMGYTDESIERSITSKLDDSLIFTMTDTFYDDNYISLYDYLMQDISNNIKDSVSVSIIDSITTYINIVKKPWIWQEFDKFGHDELPHMFHGISEEFDITTELREYLRLDSMNLLYDSNALITFTEKILIYEEIEIDEIGTNISIADELKIVEFGFKDKLYIQNHDNSIIRKENIENKTNISIFDTVWYGYKLRDNYMNIQMTDYLDYGFEDAKISESMFKVNLSDWLLTKFNLEEEKTNIVFSDSLLEIYDTNIFYDDAINTKIKDTLLIDEYRTLNLEDSIYVTVSDKLYLNDDKTFTDSLTIQAGNEQISYGTGKWFTDKIRGFILNRLSVDESADNPSDIDVQMNEIFQYNVVNDPQGNIASVRTYERLKYGMIFNDNLDVSIFRDEQLYISRKWTVNRYGVDNVIHEKADVGMEYYDDYSIDNSATLGLFDDLNIISEFFIRDTLTVYPDDVLNTSLNQERINTKDIISINNSDNLMYGVGYYDYIWDYKEWESFGYNVPYETWVGQIPHDEIPYNEFEYDQQGDDLSQITTGVYDNLIVGFDYYFKDTLNISMKDVSGFDYYQYITTFHETLNMNMIDKIDTRYLVVDNKKIQARIRTEQMKLSYTFDDLVKNHTFSYNEKYKLESIDILDPNINQIIESIFKYRMYEKIDIDINNDILTSALFKFDEYMSLDTDYKTKIDLYKERTDGSIAKSMTVIKDNTSSIVELIFGDYTEVGIIDKIQGTYAENPNVYL